MKTLRSFLVRLRGLLPDKYRDLDRSDEIGANLQLHIDDNLRRGMTPEAARREAMLKLGGLECTKEAYRDQATLPFVENLLRDLCFAIRQLRKNPGFACTAVLTLALGMCASIAIFAFVDAALVKPLPYKNPEQLVGVYEKIEKVCPLCNLSYLDYLDWKRLNTVFSGFDAYNHQGFMQKTSAGTRPAFCTRVTDGFFKTLGVSPILGRDFRPGEDQRAAPPTAILSYSKWQKDYGGKDDVLGQVVILNGEAVTIIGVLPRSFHFAPSAPTDYWLTMHASSECDLRRSCHSLYGIARLKEGVTFQAALAEVTAIAGRLELQYPGTNREQGANLSPLTQVILGSIRPILLVLLSAACLLLLIAAVNVTSLLLVRTEGRGRELAIRSGLGASASRITVQFAIEGLVLVGLGTTSGLISADLAMRLLKGLISENALLGMPYLNNLGLNARVLAFAGLIAFLSGLLFSLAPVISLSLADARQRLAEGGRGSSNRVWRRLGSSLVIVELATGVVLLAGAGLLGQSLYHLLRVKLGIQPDHVVLVDVAVPPAGYSKDEQLLALTRKIVAGASTFPGIESTGISTKSPVTYAGNTTWFKIIGRPWHGEHNDTPVISVTPDYFQTIGATLLRGRHFSDMDDAARPRVVIVNEAFVRQFFPREDPIGKQLSPLSDPPKPIQIIGEVQDIKESGLDSETRPTLYYPFAQETDTYFSVAARSSGADVSVLSALHRIIRKIDPDLVVMRPRSMTAQIAGSQSAYFHRSVAVLVGAFALCALLLGVIGLYGVTAYSVGLRTREVGIRMALGAERVAIYRLILTEAGRLITVGLVLGVLCSIGTARLIRGLLFGVSAWDAPTLISVAAIMTLCALAASFAPARRAASLNPVAALRAE
ncbi:MAG TPA: ABC transporter permease [Bryobacteraceae bacterium]|jgi:predicted permease|nr:ABC transporter permease [Bryobacteraceae bacterium]